MGVCWAGTKGGEAGKKKVFDNVFAKSVKLSDFGGA